MRKNDIVLYESLLERNLIKKEELDSLAQEAQNKGLSLKDYLLERKYFSEQIILEIFSHKLGLNIIDLKSISSVEKQVLERVPVRVALYYKFLPLQLKERTLTIAASEPLEIKTQDEIRTQLGLDLEVVLACSEDIQEAIKRNYGLAADIIKKSVSAIPSSQSSTFQATIEKIEDLERLSEDVSVINLVNQIILEAWKKRATDIHFEPYRDRIVLRYRIDGLLYDQPVVEELKNLYNAIVSRIKIMSNLNIVERRLPQDGRAIVEVQKQLLDLRISTLPTPFGESMVIRILPTRMLFSLEKLGLSKRDLKIFEALIQKPHGIIFVTGPTGSGKTTTLYASLLRINTRERKIITLEDPIEYEIPGIIQIQVQPEIGLDFARGLRSILRHDPDVIMVGEVRDFETAETAIRMALTGHLVFSTLHTNDAPGGISRLLDIGVEPYLLASSVEAIIAQRLVRLICTDCKYEDKDAPLELKSLISKDLGLSVSEVKIFRGKGCPSCNFTGFFGRTAIYEILVVDEVTREQILKKVPASKIKEVAITRGMYTLRQDGWQKVISGFTTPEEIFRVTSSEMDLKKEETSSQDTFISNLSTFQDRRVYPRLDAKINLKYKVFSKEQIMRERPNISEEFFTVSKNLSAGGMLFYTDQPLEIGAILEITLEIPDNEPALSCLAKVVRVEEIESQRYAIAVCFLDLEISARKRLNKYLET